ncbi:glycosyltransferase family 4 protein [Comamonas sp. EJ-4]|uniref:Glycosyltransferase family 4 protein n=1 Tax=Comamonas suwonensis TaxID=2606214 RepID=A0A843AVG0_9BURK|nr:glycosyltransferase family 4 protein [Comamonas suwonensis]
MTVPIPRAPSWATVAHVNTWLHTRFLPRSLPIVATIHHAIHHKDACAYKDSLQAAYHRWWIAPNERRILRRAHQVVAVSRFVANSTRHSLLDIPMHTIYNGIDTEQFRPNKHQLSKHFRLLFVGSWKPLKGVDLLAPIMRKLGSNFLLHYTGGPLAKKDKAHMPPNMIDIGRLPIDKVIAVMQSADALLFPSRSEGFGLVAVEAMACGLPVIAARNASLSEVVADGKTGVLCQPDDVEAFVSAARSMATNTAQHTTLAQAGRLRALEQFSETAMVDAYMHLYHSTQTNSNEAL